MAGKTTLKTTFAFFAAVIVLFIAFLSLWLLFVFEILQINCYGKKPKPIREEVVKHLI
jgi:hypothetical protein